MKKCSACGKYVLSNCACGGAIVSPEPPKFSPADRHWKQRLKARGVEI